MPDMPGHSGQHRSQRARVYWMLEVGVPHQRPNRRYAVFCGKPVQPGDGVDVDRVSRPR